jgi:LemA protein
MSFGLILLIGLAAVALYVVGIYNGLVSKRVAVESAWSQIDVQLKRRYDLIPNLVETVKGYAKHESGTLEAVIKARNSAITTSNAGSVADKAAAEGALSGALRQVFALAENYPDLKANQNFLSLQGELAATENLISHSREGYNDAVTIYNVSIEQVPANFVANFGGFTKKQFFEIDAAEAAAVKQAPKVAF